MAIVDALKKQIKDAGGDTAGIHTIEDACKNLSSIGGGGGVMFVHLADGHLDKTFAEIDEAFLSGTVVMYDADESYSDADHGYTHHIYHPLNKVDAQSPTQGSDASSNLELSFGSGGSFLAIDPDDYPTLQD